MAEKKNTELRRSLNLTLLVFYGLGTTIGAGIYVLVGVAAGYAGIYAPIAFIVAALGLAPTAISYAELSGRMPVSAGEAAFVRKGFNSRSLALLTGFLVILSGVVSSATIAIGSAGYLSTFLDIPIPWLITIIILVMGLIAIWGIMESVMLAALFTLIEAGGLIALILFGFNSEAVDIARIPEMLPPLGDIPIWIGIMNAGVLAVFAFIGFEDMVNVAEETKNPKRTLPWAIFLTIGITTVLYTLVAIVAVLAIPPAELATSEAPLSLVFERVSGISPMVIGAIAVFATANTILVQFIMASRVVYGLASRNAEGSLLAQVDRRTRTPIIATLLILAITLILALLFPLEQLAEMTSRIMLIIWTFINIALLRIKWRGTPAPEGTFLVPIWIPALGALLCGLFLVLSFFI